MHQTISRGSGSDAAGSPPPMSCPENNQWQRFQFMCGSHPTVVDVPIGCCFLRCILDSEIPVEQLRNQVTRIKKKESLTRYELVPQWCTPFCWPIVNFWKKTNKEGYHASKNSTRDLKFQGCSSLLVKLNHFTKLNKTNDFLWLILTIWFLTPNFCQHGVQEGLGVSSDMLVHMLLQYHFHQLETWK